MRADGCPGCRRAQRLRSACATLRRLIADGRGVSAVEFALLAPVFLGLFFGVVEFVRVAYTQGVVSFAAEEAPRYALVTSSIDETAVRHLAQACLLGIHPPRSLAIIVHAPVDPVANPHTLTPTVSSSFYLTP